VRGRIAVTGVILAILAVIVGISFSQGNGPRAGNYCLYSGTDTQTGTFGTLAVPQPGATQSTCDDLGISVQQAFANSQAGTRSFEISSDRPVTLSTAQAKSLMALTSGTGWLVYSGDI
jgi:hypothetical protein